MENEVVELPSSDDGIQTHELTGGRKPMPVVLPEPVRSGWPREFDERAGTMESMAAQQADRLATWQRSLGKYKRPEWNNDDVYMNKKARVHAGPGDEDLELPEDDMGVAEPTGKQPMASAGSGSDALVLPADVVESTLGPGVTLAWRTNGGCCKKRCTAIDDSAPFYNHLKIFKGAFHIEDHEKQNAMLFNMIRGIVSTSSDKESHDWFLLGRPVCREGFASLLGVSSQRVSRLFASVKSGMDVPPMDGRRHNTGRPPEARYCVDAFLHYLWEFVAEPLAETDDPPEEAEEPEYEEAVPSCGAVEGSLDIVDRTSLVAASLSERWLGFCKRVEIFEQYKYWHSTNYSTPPVSQSTFNTVWKQDWKKAIKIRGESLHARCDECARLSQLRKKAETEAQKLQIQEGLATHLQHVFADRAADEKLAKFSQASNHASSSERSSRIIKIDLDGMDQAKFKVPRNLDTTHKFAQLWRPQLHVVCAIAHGVGKYFFAYDSDMKKDPNCQRTTLSRVLDLVAEELGKRNLTMPPHIVFHVPGWAPNQRFLVLILFLLLLLLLLLVLPSPSSSSFSSSSAPPYTVLALVL